MNRFMTCAVAAALTAGLNSSAWSQGGQAGGTSGSAGAAARAGAQTAAGQNQIGNNPLAEGQFSASNQNFGQVNRTPFFTDPGARQQLNLNDNQFNQLNRAYQDAYSRYSQGVERLNRGLTEQQRMQQVQQLQARFNQDLNTSLDTTFTDPQLRQRYNQLNWQFQGPMAFNDPTLRQQLNLTPAQQQQLNRLASQWQQQLGSVRVPNGADPRMTQDQWLTLRTRYQNQLGGILTPAQQRTYTQFIGQPYDFPVNLYFQSATDATVQPQANPQNQQLQRAQRQAPATQPPGTVR